MQDFQGKIAFVTGGASGIGFAMAKAFGAAGMNVMLADIEREPLEKAVEDLRQRQIKVEGVHCDVAERASVEDAAKATIAESVPKGTVERNIEAYTKGFDYGLSTLKGRIKRAAGQTGALAQ